MHAEQEPFLTNAFGDTYLYSINAEEFNQSGSAAVYSSKLAPSFFQENSLHLVIGTDSGLLPAFVAARGVPRGSRYLFIEPDDLIDRIWPHMPPSDNRILLSTPSQAFNDLNTKTELGESFYFFHGKVLLHRSLAALAERLPVYADSFQTLGEDIRARTFVHQGRGNQRNQLMNMLINAPENPLPADQARDLFAGKTAVLLAAGPSLSEGFDWIRHHRQDLLVIAISRVCGSLHREGLAPDIIVSMDPLAVNFHQSLGIFQFPDSVLAHTAYCNHSLVSLWQGRKLLLGDLLPWTSGLNSDYVASYDVTVTNAAMDLAYWLGCQQILLFGVDLCHRRDGKVYAEGNDPTRSVRSNLVKVRTNAGPVSFTTSDYFEAARGIGEQAGKYRQTGVRCINPCGTAMAIDEIDYLSLDQVEPSPLDEPALPYLHRHLPQPEDADLWQALERELHGKSRRLQELHSWVKQGQKLIEIIKGGNRGQKNPFPKLRQINQRLGQDEDASFVQKLHWDHFAALSIDLENNEQGSAVRNQERYFAVFSKALHETQDGLQIPLEKIRLLRRDIQAPAEEGIAVIAWGKFLSRLPVPSCYSYDGICHRWIRAFPEKHRSLSGEWRDSVDRCAQLFTEKVAKACDPPPPAAPVSGAQLKKVLANSLPLWHQFMQAKDSEGLQALEELLGHYAQDIAAPYRWLCNGARQELDGNTTEACDAYQEAARQGIPAISQQALERVAQISLDRGDVDRAIAAVKELIKISPSYHKTHAEILAAIGQVEDAVTAYLSYHQQFPSDLGILPNLAALMLHLGQATAFVQLCDEMLSRNPDNAYVLELKTRVQ